MDKEILRGIINGAIGALVGVLLFRFVWPRKVNAPTWKILLFIIVVGIVDALILLMIEHLL